MITCPHCHGVEQQVKVGANPSGSQRYLCKVCQRKYTPEPKRQGYSPAKRQEAVKLYLDGMNLRRIGRTLKLAHQTVSNWVNARAAELPAQPPSPAAPLAVNELDELFSFVGQKKTKSTSSRR